MPRKTKNTVASEITVSVPASGSSDPTVQPPTLDIPAVVPPPTTPVSASAEVSVASVVPPPATPVSASAEVSEASPSAPKKKKVEKKKAEKKKPKASVASTSDNVPDDDDDADSSSDAETEDAIANAKQRKVNTSELLSVVIDSLNVKCTDMTSVEDMSDKDRKFKKAWTGLSNDQKSILTSMILYSTFDVTKTKICDGYAVAFNGLITLKATCQLARKWLSPPTSSGKPTEVGDRLRARFSICEDLKRKLAEAPVPEQLKEKAVQKKHDAATKAAAKATKQSEA